MKQAGKQQGIPPLPGPLDASHSQFIYQEDTHFNPVPERPKRTSDGSCPETGLDLHCCYCFSHQGSSTMEGTVLMAPFAQQLLSR